MASEWINARLEEYIDSCLGKMLDKNKNKGELYPYLGNSNVRWGSFDLDDLAHMKFEKHEHERYGIKYGDLIVCEGGEPGRCAIWEEDLPDMKIQKALHRVRTKDGLDSEFLYYWFLHSGRSGLLDAFFTGTTIKHLTGKALKQLPIKIPPLQLQHQVARVLRPLDKKIKLNQQTNQTLEQIAQALFKSWFVDFDPVVDNALAAGNPIPDELSHRVEVRKKAHVLPDFHPLPEHILNLFPSEFEQTGEPTVGIDGWIPKEWNIVSFGEISKCFDSKRIPLSRRQRDEKKPGSIPYYGATSVMDYVDDYIFDGIFLLVGEDGSVVKPDGTPYTQYIWGKSWVNNHAHILQGKGSISTEHLLLFMNSTNINAYVTGAVQMKINQKNMNSIPFIEPTDQICENFNELLKPIFQKIRYQAEQNRTLKMVRDYLLPKLIAGEIQLDSSGVSSINQEAELQGV